MVRTPTTAMQSPPRSGRRSGRQTVYPISRLQREILLGLALPETTELWKQRWFIDIAFRVRPGVDLKRAKRAFETVAARHDGLRMTFRQQNGQWSAVVDDRPQAGVFVHDAGAVSDEELLRLVNEKAREEYDLETGPLTQLHIFRCSDAGDALLIRQHHVISDGASFLLLLDELVKAYLGVPFWGGKPMGFGQYLERHDRLPAEAEEISDRYWEELLLPALPMPQIGCAAKGHAPKYSLAETRPSGRVVSKLTQEGTDFVDEQVRRSQTTKAALSMAACSTALAEVAGADGVYLNTNLARLDSALASFIGLVVYTFPIRCDVAGSGSIPELAKVLYKQFREGLPHVLSDACLVRERFDDMINSQGGHLRQFGYVMPEPDTAYGSSIAASLLRSGADGSLKIGSLEVETLAIASPQAVTAEMVLSTSVASGPLEMVLSYDPLGFEMAEAERISEIIARYLQLRPEHIAETSRHLPEAAGRSG